MTFDNTTLGLLLFYATGAIMGFAIAIIYWSSKREQFSRTVGGLRG